MKIPGIWEEEAIGPEDTKEHVFLSRAFDKIGRHIFGSDWTGQEGRQRHQPLGDDEAEQYFDPPIDLDFESVKPFPKLRFLFVAERIARSCKDGTLVSARRPKEGGDRIDIPHSWWDTENYYGRFEQCSIDTKTFDCGGPNWLFLTRKSLCEFLRLNPPDTQQELADGEVISARTRRRPGRPTSIKEVLSEFESRIKSGAFCETLAAESDYLHDYSKRKGLHPLLSSSAIRNDIRRRYREACRRQP